MLMEEARWLGREMEKRAAEDLSPLLDLGSSSEDFRKALQPWVNDSLYGPLLTRGIEIRHQDIRARPGVDIVGDLTDPGFIEDLAAKSFRSVLCANLLEHVTAPDRVSKSLVKIVPPGGYLFVSCPYRFPYHPDPIDTRFRPDVEALAALFPSTEVVAGEIVRCSTYFDHLYPMLPRWKALLMHGIRLCLPFYGPAVWLLKVLHLPWLFRRLEATCLVLRKKR
jgi:SAM-dependent methyltransferase